jgi:hypothetical protein
VLSAKQTVSKAPSRLRTAAITCFVDHVCWFDLVQVLHQVLAVNHGQHSIQLAGVLQIIIHKEGLQHHQTTQQHPQQQIVIWQS